jgi:hypothetical protein
MRLSTFSAFRRDREHFGTFFITCQIVVVNDEWSFNHQALSFPDSGSSGPGRKTKAPLYFIVVL